MSALMGRLSYFIVFVLFCLWAVRLGLYLKAERFSLRQFLSAYYPGLVLSFTVAVVLFVSIGLSIKNEYDEQDLLSMSQSMVFGKTIYRFWEGLHYYGNFNVISREIPTRPLLFPFLVSLLHTFFGFSAINAFLLNFICLFIFLSGVFILTRRSLDSSFSAAAVFFIASCPVFAIFSVSGGFDLLSALFFGLTLVSCYGFMAKPTGTAFSLFWMNAMMFCHVRYESFVYFFIMLGILSFSRAITPAVLKESAFWISFTPVFFLPVAWQRILVKAGDVPPGIPGFSFSHFKEHVWGFIRNQYHFLPLPHYLIMNIALLLIAVFLFVDVFIRKKSFREEFQRRFILLLGLCTVFGCTLGLSWWGGGPSNPTGTRYFLFFSALASLLPVVLCIARSPGLTRFHGRTLLLASVAVFFACHPAAVDGRTLDTLIGKREDDAVVEAVREVGRSDIVVVTHLPELVACRGIGAVGFDYANAHAGELLSQLGRHLFRDIVVVQQISESTGKPEPEWELKSDYVLEPPFFELETVPGDFIRASRVRHAG